jgi:hypothetical protein
LFIFANKAHLNLCNIHEYKYFSIFNLTNLNLKNIIYLDNQKKLSKVFFRFIIPYSREKSNPERRNFFMSLYPNLEKAMIDKETSRKQIAEFLEIAYSDFNKRMRGETEFTWKEVQTLSDFFDVDPKELFRKREEGKGT